MSKELVVLKESDLPVVYQDPEKMEEVLEQIEMEVATFEHNLSTGVGRGKTKSLASNISKAKVLIDNVGKALTEKKRKEVKTIDSARKAMRDRLDALKVVARQPVTDWENEEQAKKEYEEWQAEQALHHEEMERDHPLGLEMNAIHDEEVAEHEKRLKAELAEQKIQLERQAEEQAKHAAEQAVKDEQDRVAREEAQEAQWQEAQKANRAHAGKIHSGIVADLIEAGVAEADAKSVVRALVQGKVRNVHVSY
ncbi:coil containing protein [Vibrio phage 1.139.A._10N.261.48.C6]|nr:coil containing protein [Vibrio phage 1.034.O._10N.261.46.B7]AUR83468.1 coil containing protein [Vibrio phage 1.034.X._10N.261.46.B7]AUR90206.1 coil containing protein [Vibrio phage 1.139.A._10N.261.48.C6]AUR90273.1 coil containing protein [Vibrio phage 1.139.B._10N.261.48.C6]AUR95594.1 coil containing protein [Vibrio phage 1.209.O._10N.222.52.B2]